MASQGAESAATTGPSPTPAPADHHPPSTSPTPVEMDALPSHEQDKAPETQHTEQSATITSSSPAPPQQPSHPDSGQPDTAVAPATTTNPPPSQQDPSTHTRKPSEALGPATETPLPNPTSTTSPTTGPVLLITLMLTTGQRHPYKIDEKYLANRNTTATTKTGEDFDPLRLSGYKLKELIWTDWRSEWEPRPAAPGSIRLIIYGKMVEDKKSLSDYNFNLATNNILHMTVKPADFGDDDDQAGTAKQGHKSSTLMGRRHRRHQQGDVGDEDAEGAGGGGAGCRCVIL
ncbi:hypothetical protein D0862_08298 [Hortaea werneckii]|uniref:UBL3-like ubiquitin domain-containing protein n=1 Tax=Hortaea werneckii TaxID=91943 RepID=A0A3M7G767_HORWE|nr:hypothetical protein D0862_08298 [Hortaea werneckii]